MPIEGTDFTSAFQFQIQTGMDAQYSDQLDLFRRPNVNAKLNSIDPRQFSLFETDGPLNFDPETIQIVKLKESYNHLNQVEKVNLQSIETLSKAFETSKTSIEDAGKLLRKTRETLGIGRLIDDKDLDDLLLAESTYLQKLDTISKLYFEANEKKIKESTEILESISGKLKMNRELIHEFLKSIIPEESRKSNLCSICFEKELNACLNPCGHSFCKDCTTKFVSRSCPSCRINYQSILPLYL